MLGPIPLGELWQSRDRQHLPEPMPLGSFQASNLEYVKEALASRKPDKHADTMLKEILVERSEGKIMGPLAASERWRSSRVPLPQHLRDQFPAPCGLHSMPQGEPRAAMALSIEQGSCDGATEGAMVKIGGARTIMQPFL